MTKLEQLAQDLGNAVMFPNQFSRSALETIGTELSRMALEESGCPPYYLSDEKGKYENTPAYQLYFQTLSTMWAQVHAQAAINCTVFRKTLNLQVEP
jgi:hypothetical protein